MRYTSLILLALVCTLTTGCIQHKVEADIKPIHIVADVNIRIKVDRELDSFFDFQDEIKEELDKSQE